MTWIHEFKNNGSDSARFVLGLISSKPLICFGVNPSTAKPEKLDPTMESVDRITKNNNFASWIMLNLYPQQETNPDKMHDEPSSDLHKENLKHIEKIFEQYPKAVIWAAWGDLITTKKYLKENLADIIEISKKYECTWVAINKKTKNNNPPHPLFKKSTEKLTIFDIDTYLKKF